MAGIALASIAANFSLAQSAPKPTPMTIVVYEAGPAWQADKAPEAQLGPHFAYVEAKLKEGTLVANGLQSDAFRGYYVVSSADPAVVKGYVDNDPAIKTHSLKIVEEIGWAVLIKAFSPTKAGDAHFILLYQPGKAWMTGKPMSEQAIGPHFSYMTEQAKSGVVIAAGPDLSADGGIYIVRVKDKASVDALLANDPGVASGIFAPVAIGWNVLNMHATK